MSSCFFIGHHDAPPSVMSKLTNAIEWHISELGVTEFIVGNYGAFDSMAASAIKAAKLIHSHITRYLLLPYHPAERPTTVPDGFDGTYYPFLAPVPHRLAIIKANRYMIDTCNYLIAYVAHPGNARNLWDYAQSRVKKGMLHTYNLCSAAPDAE